MWKMNMIGSSNGVPSPEEALATGKQISDQWNDAVNAQADRSQALAKIQQGLALQQTAVPLALQKLLQSKAATKTATIDANTEMASRQADIRQSMMHGDYFGAAAASQAATARLTQLTTPYKVQQEKALAELAPYEGKSGAATLVGMNNLVKNVTGPIADSIRNKFGIPSPNNSQAQGQQQSSQASPSPLPDLNIGSIVPHMKKALGIPLTSDEQNQINLQQQSPSAFVPSSASSYPQGSNSGVSNNISLNQGINVPKVNPSPRQLQAMDYMVNTAMYGKEVAAEMARLPVQEAIDTHKSALKTQNETQVAANKASIDYYNQVNASNAGDATNAITDGLNSLNSAEQEYKNSIISGRLSSLVGVRISGWFDPNYQQGAKNLLAYGLSKSKATFGTRQAVMEVANLLAAKPSMDDQPQAFYGGVNKARAGLLAQRDFIGFMRAASNKGLSPADADALWSRYQSDLPAFDVKHQVVNTNYINKYDDYINHAKSVLNHQYIPIPKFAPGTQQAQEWYDNLSQKDQALVRQMKKERDNGK